MHDVVKDLPGVIGASQGTSLFHGRGSFQGNYGVKGDISLMDVRIANEPQTGGARCTKLTIEGYRESFSWRR